MTLSPKALAALLEHVPVRYRKKIYRYGWVLPLLVLALGRFGFDSLTVEGLGTLTLEQIKDFALVLGAASALADANTKDPDKPKRARRAKRRSSDDALFEESK